MNIADYNFNGKKALVRVDFNVPLNSELNITDDTRIRAALPTINKIIKDGGIPVLMSHLGRPKSGPEDKFSLGHLVNHLSELTEAEVVFAADTVGAEAVKAFHTISQGQILLLENLRFNEGETSGDEAFAKKLSQLGDVYVNDAFGTAHRAHASTAIIAQHFSSENKMFGHLLSKEIENINKVLNNPERPFTAIIGGAKISGKIDVIENLLSKVDHLLIGGGMAYTFLKAQGYNIGKSLYEADKLDTAIKALRIAGDNAVQIHLPVDSVAADDFKDDAITRITEDQNIPEDWMGLDIGPETITNYKNIIQKSSTLLWNGPMGVFEMEKFQKGTVEVAQAIAEATSEGAYSLIGGGDSVAAINKFELSDKVSYISTGGGAMLELLEGKTLPGVAAILAEDEPETEPES